MKSGYHRIVIAGLKGGSGKTTLSLGLIAALRKKGLTVAPFKKGPDYIDAGWLSSAAGRPCYNLDPFLITEEKILSSFHDHFAKADCAVIEGNRGLYDGMDAAGTYSTAALSKILKAPVILIMDCTKVTRTAAAMVLGMQRFDKKVNITGVVLNQVAGQRHQKIVTETIEKHCKIPVLGAIPKLNKDFLSERHMGLTPFQEHPEVAEAIHYAAEIAEKYLDLQRILKIARNAPHINNPRKTEKLSQEAKTITDDDLHRFALLNPSYGVKIGIIRDAAFQFYYPENFEELRKRGGRLVEINALKEKKLPDIDALYIGGGFPETNAITLARNISFRKSLKTAIESGLPVYAECGGMMYLGSELISGGRTFPMAGIFPVSFRMEKRPQAHGYTIVKTTGENPFFRKGLTLKGHEFHYSRPTLLKTQKAFPYAFTMIRGHGVKDNMDGLCYKNVLATYTHLHALGSPEWADGLIQQALSYAGARG